MANRSTSNRYEMDDNLKLEDAFSSLPKLLAKKQKDLEEREKHVEHREELLKSALGGAEPSDVLDLNVGGRQDIAVLRRTLTSVKNSMMEAKFSGRWDDSLERDKNGRIFIDHDPDVFLTLVNFLRDKAIDTDEAPKLEVPSATNSFLRLVAYYGLTLAVYPIHVTPADGTMDNIEVAKDYPQLSISSSSSDPLDLVGDGHGLRVQSFEIVLIGQVTALQVGWRDKQYSFESNGKKSVSLDFFAKTMMNGGSSEELSSEMQSAEIAQGTTVKCVRESNSNFRWEVGEAVQTTETAVSYDQPVPFFTVRGNIQIINIHYG